MKFLYKIDSPADLKKLNIKELKELSSEIREYLVHVISKQGGHLSSNLGIVELTITLLRAFELPIDKVFYDCGHQSYVHKILTGRKTQFNEIREYKKISGFQDMEESVYDVYSSGHTSNSLSIAMGMAIGKKIKKSNEHIVPVIGDGALTGGIAMEALNNIASSDEKIIICLNDNGMSISSNNTAVSKFRNSKPYKFTKGTVKKTKKIPLLGKITYGGTKILKNMVKKATIGNNFFESLGIKYIGPINGHKISDLEKAFEIAKKEPNSCVVHVLTEKGKGVGDAMEDPYGNFHGLSENKCFQLTDQEKEDESKKISWSQAIANIIERNMKLNPSIQVITPAMLNGSALLKIQEHYPDRVFDVGIAEQHALSLASGMALANLKPFVSIYSTFLQRGYDQLVHDIARLDLPVIIGIDRAGLSSRDGATHHGVLDMAMIKSIPNFILMQAKNFQEARELIGFAIKYNGPIAIRYERGKIFENFEGSPKEISLGTWTIERKLKSPSAYVICYGNDVMEWTNTFIEEKKNIEVINARFLNPIDKLVMEKIAKQDKHIFIIDKNYVESGLSDSIKKFLYDNKLNPKIYFSGLNFEFIKHGSTNELLKESKLDKWSLKDKIYKIVKD